MGTIIPFPGVENKNKVNLKQSLLFPSFCKSFSSYDDVESFISHMAESSQDIIFSDEANAMEKKERERKRWFVNKYINVLNTLPLFTLERIKHYSKAVIPLVPKMFNGEYKDRFNAYYDFGEFFFRIDSCASMYAEEHQNASSEYNFEFRKRTVNELEKDILSTLNKIVCFDTNSNPSDVLYQLDALSELNGLVTDLFTGEIQRMIKEKEMGEKK